MRHALDPASPLVGRACDGKHGLVAAVALAVVALTVVAVVAIVAVAAIVPVVVIVFFGLSNSLVLIHSIIKSIASPSRNDNNESEAGQGDKK